MGQSSGDDSTQGEDSRLLSEDAPTPERIARYRIKGVLGTGSFGAVYLASDETLDREVAIKVPRRKAVSDEKLTEEWTREARVVAGLDHPHIVPVYDVGTTDEHPFYVVTKLISGSDLRARVIRKPSTIQDAIRWIASIADALHYAHTRGLVHRDVKPSNILIDADDNPWLTDFGLALREADLGKGPSNLYIGTFRYMSPEQARGEGHLVDGRADIFSLGIVFYELLTGTLPFHGESSHQLLTNIVRAEPRPLRVRAPKLPVEVERICLKALAKRVSDRYYTALDMAGDLRRFVDAADTGGHIERPIAENDTGNQDTVIRVSDSTKTSEPTIVPKGLRAFDEHDQSFFLKLVPGPRDIFGIPELILRWKTRIETDKPDETFRVGLIYGASGSGKSSLVRAGLIPLLDDHIHVAFVEATSKDTESRLLRALPDVGVVPRSKSAVGTDTLTARMASLRQSRPSERKVLIVLDQFEQWLHSQRALHDCELINALRQCDGVHVQCIVLIRDDFWMDATRFFHELDIRLIDGVNSAPVDRFDLRHARFVLTEFGRAFGCLPMDSSDLTQPQSQFLDQIIDSIQEDEKVISIHLVLLAQMLRGREWIPETISQFGGTEAIGMDFLNATFAADSASPLHRSLQEPARAVLGALLPDAGTNIKGQMQSAADLRVASRLSERDFLELIEVLDGQLRLITPAVGPDQNPDEAKDYFQLTHDFLVPSLRSWLTQKQRESVSGRAKLRMQELSQLWRRKPENRYLPGVVEFSQMALLTKSEARSKDENRMMSAAARHHALRWGLAAAVVAVMAIGAVVLRSRLAEQSREFAANLLVNQLLAARFDEVPQALRLLEPMADDAQPRLHAIVADESASQTDKLRSRMALLSMDDQQIQPLAESVTSVSTDDLILLRELLSPHGRIASNTLWKHFQAEDIDESAWLQIAYALAQFSSSDERWPQYADRLCDTFVNQNPMRVSRLAAGFAPMADELIDPLSGIFADPTRSYQQRTNAAALLAECCQQRDELLTDFVCMATPSQFAILFPIVEAKQDSLLPMLRKELQVQPTYSWPDAYDANRASVAESLRHTFKSASGMITDSFAVCQDLPFADFDSLAAELDPLGYRPECIRPYFSAGEEFVAAIWIRDGRPWQFSRHANADTVPDHASAMRELGLMPTDVASLPADPAHQSEPSYGVLWAGSDQFLIDAALYVGVSESDHSSAWGPLNDGGYIPKSNLKTRGRDGQVRYSSVRRKMRIGPSYVDAWDDSQADYSSRILDGWHQIDVRLNPSVESFDASIAAVWLNGGNLESRSLDSLRMSDHQASFAQLRDEGFRPASISVIAASDGPVGASVWHRPVIDEQERDRIAGRQANALIAMYRLGETNNLWPLLEQEGDRRLRSFLIDRFATLDADPRQLAERFLNAPIKSAERFAIIAALSHFRIEQLPLDLLEQLQSEVARLGKSDASAGVHSICQYLCRRWELTDLENEIAAAPDPQPADAGEVVWRHGGNDHVFAVIRGPSEFKMGSPGDEAFRDHAAETTRRCRIPRSYAISTMEVTVEQYRRFDPSFGYAGDYTPSQQCPINMVSWLEALRYCRWLCDQEEMDEDEIPYPPIDQIKRDVTFPANLLSRTGYRLPTSAEWEYACRARSHTSRHYGNAEELLDGYAWTVANSHYQLHPVGVLLPNEFGLFDLLGNAKEWCHDKYQYNLRTTKRIVIDDGRDDLIAADPRTSRGGAFLYAPVAARSASLERGGVTSTSPYTSFRIARTIRD